MAKSEENALISDAVEAIFSINHGGNLSHAEIQNQAESLVSTISRFAPIKSRVADIVDEYEDVHGQKTFSTSFVLKDKKTEDSWLYRKKESMDEDEDSFKIRYRDFLINSEKLDADTADYIINEAESILACCSDPTSGDRKKGLVMGDVQSGKTANYLALASLAFDYGYRIVLILSGITETLRVQTQGRVDKGIVGAKSSSINSGKFIPYYLCSRNKKDKFAIPLTDDLNDFSPDAHVNSTDMNKPQILVVKKNKAILENVKRWLKPGEQYVSSENILIIDDECDNASVNTRADTNPTTINGLIRDIYNNFTCATYVGYTATPFANIFINPNETDENYVDLFPKDFIYRLRTSDSTYFGIDKVFRGDNRYIGFLDDKEPYFIPVDHKISFAAQLHTIPESMKDAICTFLLCCCVRTLRGDGTAHRTMMINVSRFNGVQEELQGCINRYIEILKNTIAFNHMLSMDRFLSRPELKRIYDLYFDPMFDIARSQFSFDDIKPLLNSEIEQFFTILINSKVKDEDLFRYDSDEYKDKGARVIAIGGFALSRGLTLEGLMVSYYSRNTNAYDTLLQMCRWFGYRKKYEDLCKIYMTPTNHERFCIVVEAIDNLDEQLERMSLAGKKPESYGLMINETPFLLDTKLISTAPTKSKHSFMVDRNLNFSGFVVDTYKLSSDLKTIEKNASYVDEFINRLISNGYHIELCKNRTMIRDIPKEYIADFVKKLIIPPENSAFKVNSLSSFINEGKYFKKWDIVFATGNTSKNKSDKKLILNDNGTEYPVTLALRSFVFENNNKILTFYKSHNRMLDPGIFNSGLTDEQIEEAESYAIERAGRRGSKSKSIISEDYLAVDGRKPLLVILPVQLNDTVSPTDDSIDTEKQEYSNSVSDNGATLYGFGIGIPGKKDERIIMRYRENLIKHSEDLDEEYNDLEDDYDD